MERLTVLWLLLVGLNFALAVDIPKYFLEGGELTLEVKRPSSERITNILWKFNGDLLAEWVKDSVPLTYYSTFKGRSTLDITTRRLVISRMTQADAGWYSVDINNKVLGDNYNAVPIKAVPKPKVELRTLTCASTSESCNVTCEADIKGCEPVTYSWKMGDGEWKVSKDDLIITKADNSHVKTITCRVQNPLTVEDSEPEDNPLFLSSPRAVGPVGAVTKSLAILALLGPVTLLVWWKRETVRKLMCPCVKGDDNAA